MEYWRLVDDSNPAPYTPMKIGDRWVVVLVIDGKARRIYAKSFEETWTNYDPERENKNVFDEKYRRGLPAR